MKRKIFSILFALVLVLSFSLVTVVPAVAQGETYYVATTGSDEFGDGTETWVDNEPSGWGVEDTGPWLTIQYAINTVDPYDTISMAAGMYTENVDVNKQVTIIGAGEVNTMVTAANDMDHVFEVTADGVSISGFTVTGANKASYSYREKSGIFIDDADNCTIDSVTAEDNNIGIFLDHSGGSTVTGCTATNNIRFGIYLEWSDGNVISNNDASSNGQDGSWASTQSPGQIGIYLKWSNNNELTGNTANSNIGGESTWGSSGSESGIGIYVWAGSSNVLIDNIANDNDCLGDMPNTGIGIYLYQASGTADSKTILTGNTANGNSSSAGTTREKSGSGIVLYQTHYADLTDNEVNGNQKNGYYSEGAIGNFVHDNIVTGTTATGNNIGFYLVNDASTYTNNTITGNTADGVRSDSYGGMSVTATNLNYNNISGNGNYGVNNLGTDLLNATNNWWGDATGPAHANNPHGGSAAGDAVSDNVNFMPWYATATTTPTTENVSVEHPSSSIIAYSDTIQGGTDAALLGDTINVANGIYPEQIVIDKSLTLMGESRDGVIIDGSSFLETNIKGIWINSSNVTVKNLTVENFGPQWCYSILAIEQVDSEGGAHPVDIANEGKTLNPLENVRVENVKFDSNATGPYLVYSTNSTVQDCFITDQLGDGIWMSWGCDDATIIGNEVVNSGNQGIWLGRHWRGSPPVTVRGDIRDNTVNGAMEAGIWFAGDGCTIENNEVMNIQGEGWSNGAVTLGVNAATSNVVVRYNKIHDNSTYGIGISAASDVTQTHINSNNIYGNTDYGVNNKAAGSLDATNNWWGNASGPTHATTNPFGIGNEVSGNVTYNPWLLEEVTPGVKPTTFDKTLALKDGWTLVSTDKTVAISDWVGTEPLVEELPDKIMAYKYTSGFVPADPSALGPLTAIYVKTKGGGGIGFNYTVTETPTMLSKDLEAGWNLISIPSTIADTGAILSPLRYVTVGTQQVVGLTTLVSQDEYNQFSGSFYDATLTDADWDSLKALNPFDGYWANMEAADTFEVVPD